MDRDEQVSEVVASAYRVPTEVPEADGTLCWDATTLVLVQARCGPYEGLGWTYGPAAIAHLVPELFAPVAVGALVWDVRGTWERMVRALRNAGRAGLAGYALSAVDVALWDLKARVLGLPLQDLLGATRAEVPVYGSGGFTTYDDRQLTEQLTAWTQEQGIPRVKIKVGESWGGEVPRDLTRMRRARQVVGDDVELYVDANGGYGRKQAIRVMAAAADLDIRWFEEPVSSDDLAGLHEVRDHVGADVTAGEYGCDLPYFRRMCEAEAVDCLQVDLSRCGGITEWLRIAAVAASYGLPVSGHCAPQLHAHVAAATAGLRHLEWFHDHARVEAMLFEGASDAYGGVVRVPHDVAGTGLTWRTADAARYRVA